MRQLLIQSTKIFVTCLAYIVSFTFSLHVYAQEALNTPAASNAQETLSVTLPDMQLKLTYSQPVKLNQVLTDTQNLKLQQPKPLPFWLAAQWIEPAKNTIIQKQKQKLIGKLEKLTAQDKDSRHKAQSLINTLNREAFNYRHFISLDNDWVRLRDNENPLLSGYYQLITTPRINKVRVVGVQSTLYTIDLIEHGTIDQYLEQMAIPENSDIRQVTVIQPDGALIMADNTYWNTTPVFIAPGATIFIGFDSLTDEFENLNQQIAELLRHQAPLTDKDAE